MAFGNAFGREQIVGAHEKSCASAAQLLGLRYKESFMSPLD
jgi:hypothetical protein